MASGALKPGIGHHVWVIGAIDNHLLGAHSGVSASRHLGHMDDVIFVLPGG